MSYPIGYSGREYLRCYGESYLHSEKIENDCYRIIECDLHYKTMIVKTLDSLEWEWKEMDLTELLKGDTIDMKENGCRWEGDSLEHVPFGYGCIYNNKNQLIYKGFIFEEKKVCYGSEFFGDVGIVEYEGCYYKNMRFGKGRLYNKKNELIYDGEWFNNQSMNEKKVEKSHYLKENSIHFGLEELVFEDNYLNDLRYFILNGYDNLKRLIVGKNCCGFGEADEVEIDYPEEDMIRYHIGYDDRRDNYYIDKNEVNNSESYDNDLYIGKYQIENCMQLEEIFIDEDSFGNCNHHFVIQSFLYITIVII